VAAFEELVGSHGGLGGGQSFPFILFPAGWTREKERIVGAVELHAQLKYWLNQYEIVAADRAEISDTSLAESFA